MSVVVVAERGLNRTHSGEVVAPLGPSGAPLRWELREPGRRVYAEAGDDLLAHLIRDYPGAASPGERSADLETARTRSRIRHAGGVRNQLAAAYLAAGGAQLSAQARATVLADAWHPVTLAEPWLEQVALVVLDVAYRPHTQCPAPSGNVVCLCPSSTDNYLRSLAASGWCALAEAT